MGGFAIIACRLVDADRFCLVFTVKMLLQEHPDDPVLKRMSGELAAGLSDSRDKEKAAREREGASQDPLTMASEMMALSEEEMNKWQKVFATLDVEKSGVVAISDLFIAIEEPETLFARDMFVSVDALDPNSGGGGVEFADFLRAVSTYCMFGPPEILRSSDTAILPFDSFTYLSYSLDSIKSPSPCLLRRTPYEIDYCGDG